MIIKKRNKGILNITYYLVYTANLFSAVSQSVQQLSNKKYLIGS